MASIPLDPRSSPTENCILDSASTGYLANGKIEQLNFPHADRLMAARTIRNRYGVRRRSTKAIERRHTHLGMGDAQPT
jgi:hypothetical protein